MREVLGPDFRRGERKRGKVFSAASSALIPAKAGIQSGVGGCPVYEIIIKVPPLRVVCFDQVKLPEPFPFLYLTLAGESSIPSVMHFKPDEALATISRCEAGKLMMSVLPAALYQIIRVARIERAITLTADKISVERHRKNIS